jgi:AmmeMemoRadiSam system protein A
MAATPSTRLEPAARQVLLQTAAAAIEAGLSRAGASEPASGSLTGELGEPRASFVTILLAGALRGCCGTLEPARPLLLDVWHNARASAFRDPRFAPLTAGEWRRSQLEVSVLTPCERVVVASEQELLLRLVPGRDGLVLAWRGMRATFLPKVWEQLQDPRDFLGHLKQKAGWPADFWAADLEIWRYETEIMATEHPAAFKAEPAA